MWAMIFIGHVGLTLLLCAPLATGLVREGHREDVPRWVGIALVVTLLPDLDVILPWFAHRGISHSLLAAGCFGIVVTVVDAVSWRRAAAFSEGSVRRAMLGFTVGTGSVLSHLIGDLITPMGVRPFLPVDSVYTLNLVYAKDIHANLAVLVAGVVVFWTMYRLSNDPVPTESTTSTELTAESEVSSVNT